MAEEFSKELAEIKEIIIRTDESQKAVLDNVRTISKDIDAIKKDLSEHHNTIIVMDNDSKHMKEAVDAIRASHEKDVNALWDRTRNITTEQTYLCKAHAEAFEKSIAEANTKTSMGIKIWIGCIAFSLILSLFGGAVYVGVLINRIKVLEEKIDFHKGDRK